MRGIIVAVAVLSGTTGGGTAPVGPPPAPVLAPYLVGLPGGAPRVGDTVRAEVGVWEGAPTSYRVTWQRCDTGELRCTETGTEGTAHVVTGADAGLGLRVTVVASGPGGQTQAASATSPAVAGGSAPAVVTAQVTTDPAGGAPGGAALTGDGVSVSGLSRAVVADFGGVAVVRGRVQRAAGGAAEQEVVLHDAAGTTVARTRTDATGRFSLSAPAILPGRWLLTGDGWWAPVRMAVRPRVIVTGTTRRVSPPGIVGIAGRIDPGVAGKLVQLQYLVPGRGWRLWKQVATGPGGRFMLTTVLQPNPAAPRFDLRIRVGVPTDSGWQFSAATSRPTTVRVG